MKIETDQNADFVLSEVFNPMVVVAPRQMITVAQRDGGIEIGLRTERGGMLTVIWYRAIDGRLEQL